MSIALWVKVEELAKRVAGIEQAQAALIQTAAIAPDLSKLDPNRPAPPPALAAQAETRRQDSLALRSEIESLMAAHVGPEKLTAKHVCKLLARNPAPKIRTIQGHMKEINAASPVPRF